MSKTISSALLTDIRKNVTTLATCIEIRRKDNKILRLTSHDRDITFEGNVYRHDLPFALSAVSAGSSMAVDNTELSLLADEVNVLRTDFERGLFEYADVTIFQVSYEDPSHGRLVMRRGWFGATEVLKTGFIKITITGLLKILDFEVGRIYTPTCDADLGDTRCKVAIDFAQAYSPINPYIIGDWVYVYDFDEMTEITVANPSFEVDGTRTIVQAITGWTRGPNSYIAVAASGGSLGTFDPLLGTYMLTGGNDSNATPLGSEHFVYQDIDLESAGSIDLDEVDDGEIMVALFAGLLQGFYLLDPTRLRLEIMDEDGLVIDARDTGYVFFDEFDEWRERALVMPLLPGSRTARIYIYFKKQEGANVNCAADAIRFYWWNASDDTPYSVQQLTRLVTFDTNGVYYAPNGSFEHAAVSNANNPTINGWATGSGNWWQVVGSLGGLSTGKDGNRFLAGGDDGGSSQQTYTATQTFNLITQAKLSQDRLTLGRYVARLSLLVGWADTAASAATVTIEQLDASNNVLDTAIVVNAEVGASVGFVNYLQDFTLNSVANKIRITLEATSPTGDGAAMVGFDAINFWFLDVERWRKGIDPTRGFGDADTVFNTTPLAYTIDEGFIWRAHAPFVDFDVVATVTDNKEFTGTDIAGADGTYETGLIRWISGDNAGLKNLVRVWTSGTKTIKLYFRSPYLIQAGDRFEYTRSCQKRFTEDCRLIFNNQINFRGFPHLPGRLTYEPGVTTP